MKKYILMMLVVLAAGFASCSNDDIPMEEKVTKKVFDTTFIVDPSGVVEPYRFEAWAGQLSTVPENAQLRLRILIYNSDGEIVELLTHKQSNYQSVWSVTTSLEAGTYNALVISDVINTNDPDVVEYWTLKDYGKINDAKLIKTPDFLGYQKEILGMGNIQFSAEVSNSSNSIDLKPVGAACYWAVENYESCPNAFWFSSNMDVNSLFWDSTYKIQVSKEVFNDYKYAYGGVTLQANDYNMSVSFMLPSQNQWFAFWYSTDDFFMIGEELHIANMKAGEQYFFLCSYHPTFENYAFSECYNVTGKTFDEWYWDSMKLYESSRAMSVINKKPAQMSIPKMNNTAFIKDLIKK